MTEESKHKGSHCQVRFTTTGDKYTVEPTNGRAIRLLPDSEDGKLLLLDKTIFARMKGAGVLVEVEEGEWRERWEL